MTLLLCLPGRPQKLQTGPFIPDMIARPQKLRTGPFIPDMIARPQKLRTSPFIPDMIARPYTAKHVYSNIHIHFN